MTTGEQRLRHVFGDTLMDVLERHELVRSTAVPDEDWFWADFSNGRLGVRLTYHHFAKELSVMPPDDMNQHFPFELVAGYLCRLPEPPIEPVDELARTFDALYPRVVQLFDPRHGDVKGLNRYIRERNQRRFGLDAP